jgi:nitrogen-specific signal transduction histidine kinase
MAGRRNAHAALLGAVAHEVGNLLAAIRLSAHLLPHASEARERARGAREIEQLAAQAGEFLAQVRPLLTDPRGRRATLSASEAVEGVRRALADAPGSEKLAVGPISGRLPSLFVDPDALHHVIVTLVRGALEAAGAGGRVTLRALRTANYVVFEIAGAGRALQLDGPSRSLPPRGRELAVRLADAVLRRDRGRVEATSTRTATRIRVVVPVAAGRTRGAR